MKYRLIGSGVEYIEDILHIYGLEKVSRSDKQMENVVDVCIEKNGFSLKGCGLDFSVSTERSKRAIKCKLFRYLETMFGECSGWGILSGVRPVKLASKLLLEEQTRFREQSAVGCLQCLERNAKNSVENKQTTERSSILFGADYENIDNIVVERLKKDYLLSHENATLLVRVARFEDAVMAGKEAVFFDDSNVVLDKAGSSLYVSIPFCPTRCSYCSFPMHSTRMKGQLMQPYVDKLCIEMKETIRMLERVNRPIDCIYIGGGTPSTLSPAMVRELGKVLSVLPAGSVKEFTFEAGRTDTITDELLEALCEIGVGRISINPQSFSDEALRRAARSRETGEFERAFSKAKALGFIINSDIILGLAGESTQGYIEGLRHLISLAPDNITIHALALKRGSQNYENNLIHFGKQGSFEHSGMTTCDNYFVNFPKRNHLAQGIQDIKEDVSLRDACKSSPEILSHRKKLEAITIYQQINREGRKILEEAGYFPYYLYRQKKILANMENIGFSIPQKNCLYNSRIMSEKCSIFAVGTGAVSKIYHSESDTHRQFSNSRSVEDYIEHFDKVLEKIEIIRAYL